MTKKNLADLTCKNTVYLTPDHILDPVRQYFGGRIPLDPATEHDNPTQADHFGVKNGAIEGNCLGNGLAINWSKYDGVFVNPPYGREIKLWCRRIKEEGDQGATIIALLPAGARFSTKYFQDYILDENLKAACFIRGRVRFLKPDRTETDGQNPYDSVLYGFNVDPEKFSNCFGHLGKTMKIEVF